MPRADTKHALLERKEVLRTPENYELDLNRNNLQETGIKSPCILNELTEFYILDNRAPDIMHNMLEGVCPLEVKLLFLFDVEDFDFVIFLTVQEGIQCFPISFL